MQPKPAKLLFVGQRVLLRAEVCHDSRDIAGNEICQRWRCLSQFVRCLPPMQIDGSFGITAAMGEMLLQAQVNKIELLPALPDAWKNKRISGLHASGNAGSNSILFTCDCSSI